MLRAHGFQGQMSGDSLSSAYASGDVFMMPSESETLGFVALEAMASGLPVVAVAAGGLTDILTNPGVTGHRLLLLWKPQALVAKLCLLRQTRASNRPAKAYNRQNVDVAWHADLASLHRQGQRTTQSLYM